MILQHDREGGAAVSRKPRVAKGELMELQGHTPLSRADRQSRCHSMGLRPAAKAVDTATVPAGCAVSSRQITDRQLLSPSATGAMPCR